MSTAPTIADVTVTPRRRGRARASLPRGSRRGRPAVLAATRRDSDDRPEGRASCGAVHHRRRHGRRRPRRRRAPHRRKQHHANPDRPAGPRPRGALRHGAQRQRHGLAHPRRPRRPRKQRTAGRRNRRPRRDRRFREQQAHAGATAGASPPPTRPTETLNRPGQTRRPPDRGSRGFSRFQAATLGPRERKVLGHPGLH